jgi:hypothetical protein
MEANSTVQMKPKIGKSYVYEGFLLVGCTLLFLSVDLTTALRWGFASFIVIYSIITIAKLLISRTTVLLFTPEGLCFSSAIKKVHILYEDIVSVTPEWLGRRTEEKALLSERRRNLNAALWKMLGAQSTAIEIALGRRDHRRIKLRIRSRLGDQLILDPSEWVPPLAPEMRVRLMAMGRDRDS